MAEPAKLTSAAPGDPIFDLCIEAMNRMREATIEIVGRAGDPRDGLTILMTAASMFGGTMAGTLMAMGELRRQDQRRVVESASHNFREGIKHGIARGLRIGHEVSGSAVQ